MAHTLTNRPAEAQRTGTRKPIRLVQAVIRPEKLDAVREALNKLNLVGGVTVTNVRGYGRQRGSSEHYMGVPYTLRFLDKVKIEIAVSNDDLQQVMTLISHLAHTGNVGDGKIFVMDLKSAMRIRTGEKGVDAL
jgi:nitrogen regulatory protein PII